VIKQITAKELKEALKHEKVLLIDVREVAEHQAEAITGAILIPLGELSQDKLPLTDKPLVLHCRSGRRSLEGCYRLDAQTPSLILYNLTGGIDAWKEEEEQNN
jgi:rhodanese-related sulfurtransferase